ncbi:MAG: hypothetical protein R3B06_04555 [Kofleriaceae bacterium]
MSFARCLAMSLCASALFLGGCLAGPDEDGPPLEQDEAALTQEPLCQDIHFDKVEYVACGIKPNGMPAKKKCTSHCTTHQTWNPAAIPEPTCVVGLTQCTLPVCEPCPY